MGHKRGPHGNPGKRSCMSDVQLKTDKTAAAENPFSVPIKFKNKQNEDME